MKKILLSALSVLFLLLANAQSDSVAILLPSKKKSYKDYDWKSKTRYVKIDPKYDKESKVFLYWSCILELEMKEGEDDESYKAFHYIIKLNDDKAIELYNKIYLPGTRAKDLVDIKCRVINPNGIVEMNDDDIKETEEDGYVNKYFAVRGLEKGSILEYFYIKKSSKLYMDGIKMNAQTNAPIIYGNMGVVYPQELIYTYKKYNNCTAEIIENTDSKKGQTIAELKDVPGFKEEKYAGDDAYRQYIIFKFERSKNNPNYKTEIYKNASKNIFNYYGDAEVSKAEKKAVAKLIKSLKLDPSLSVEDKVRTVESEIKKKYFVGTSQYTLKNIDGIMKAKVLTTEQFYRLFCEVFNQLGVDWELLATCNRTDNMFDKDFESGVFLQEVFIFVKPLNAILTPANRFTRVGWGSSSYTSNYGLFIKKAEVGGAESGVGKVKWIPEVPFQETNQTFKITAKPDLEASSVAVDLNYSATGYRSMLTQLAYSYIDGDKQKESREAIVTAVLKNAEVESVEMSNVTEDDFGKKPLEAEAKCTDKTLIEKAGNKYLLKVGELIGPQAAMYDEKTEGRICNVEVAFPHSMNRILTIVIPEGYAVKNLDSLNFNQSFSEKGKETMAFRSSYKQDGNKIIINCEEFYKQAVYPKEQWGDFLRVMNASADFNKVVLILEKN